MKRYFIEIIKKQRKGLLPYMLRGFLKMLSFGFQLGVSCRNWAFDQGWLKRYSPPVPLVISVGNIVAGGTGKTPVTLMLAKEFYNEVPIAILSRGYHSKAEHLSKPIHLCKSKGPLHPPAMCGDEPYLLAQNLPNASVYVGKNRHHSSVMAAKAGAKLLILDDGMQHRRLARDIDIVVMDNNDLFGQGHFLPRGFLREGAHSLKRANLIIVNHILSDSDLEASKEKIAKYSKAPVVGARVEISGVYDFNGEKIESLKGKQVALFCGIANPEYFKKSVESLGAHVVAEFCVGDHENFKPHTLESFAYNSQKGSAEYLLCTEKDRVKFLEPLRLPLPTGWVQMELKIVAGQAVWKQFVEKAKKDIFRRT